MTNLRQLGLATLIATGGLGLVQVSTLQAALMPAEGIDTTVGNSVQLAGAADFWDWIQRKRVPGGSRGPDETVFCAITPGDLEDTVSGETSSIAMFGLNPVFVWQGAWDEWVLYNDEGEVIDSQELSTSDRHFVYGNEKNLLQPGGLYLWSLRKEGVIYGQVRFAVLTSEEQAAVQAELDMLTAGLASEDEKAQTRADYFEEKSYSADVFREWYAMPNPPADFMEVVQEHDFCDSERA